jgi:hypothetical protein
MKRFLMIAGALAALLIPRPAAAQTVFDFDANPFVNSTGTWRVRLAQTAVNSTSWNVYAEEGNSPNPAATEFLRLWFYGADGNSVAVASANGGTVNNSNVIPVNVNDSLWTGTNDWTTSILGNVDPGQLQGPSVRFQKTGGSQFIDGHQFYGRVNLAANTTIVGAQAWLMNTSGADKQWLGSTSLTTPAAVTPEPISLAMLLPGLGPLALMLRRRMKRQEADDETA